MTQDIEIDDVLPEGVTMEQLLADEAEEAVPEAAEESAQATPQPTEEEPTGDTRSPHELGLQAALTRERRNRQEAEARANSLAGQYHELATRASTPSEPPPPPPDDPLERISMEVSDVKASLAQRENADRQRQELQYHQQQEAELLRAAALREQEFVRERPDYPEAFDYSVNRLGAYFQSSGVPDREIPGMIKGELMRVSATAMQSGRNPAEEIYNQATQFGWKPSQAPQAEPAEPAQPPSRPAPRSLSNVPRTPNASTSVSLDELLSSPEKMGKLSSDQMRALHERLMSQG